MALPFPFRRSATVPAAADWSDADYADSRWSVTARFEGREAFADHCERPEADGSAVSVGCTTTGPRPMTG